jgi:uncharacterized membrane protein
MVVPQRAQIGGQVLAPRCHSAVPSPGESSADPTSRNVRLVADLERSSWLDMPWTVRLGERVSRVAGTMGFVLVHVLLVAGWTAWNGLAASSWRFDPYPYGLLTFIVSMEGVLIATFVLIAQNRMSRRDQERDHLHLQIALLTEQELTVALGLLRQIVERVDATPPDEVALRAERLAESIDVPRLMRRLKEALRDSGDR